MQGILLACNQHMSIKLTRMGGRVASGVATSEMMCWPDPCTILFITTAERYFGVKPWLPFHVTLSTRISNCLTALLRSSCNSAKYNNTRYVVLSLSIKEFGLHMKSIRVPFTGVIALLSMTVGLSKLLTFEMLTVAEVVMLVHGARVTNLCQRRSCRS